MKYFLLHIHFDLTLYRCFIYWNAYWRSFLFFVGSCNCRWNFNHAFLMHMVSRVVLRDCQILSLLSPTTCEILKIVSIVRSKLKVFYHVYYSAYELHQYNSINSVSYMKINFILKQLFFEFVLTFFKILFPFSACVNVHCWIEMPDFHVQINFL